ncbi:MAG: hypothetical protein NXI00_04025 [Cytophagales bacterium]|nr:hypothetical protein [Cytophagales bacterium]
MQKKGKNIFKIVFILFLAIVLWLLYDMARQTSAPWNKNKQLERAIDN